VGVTARGSARGNYSSQVPYGVTRTTAPWWFAYEYQQLSSVGQYVARVLLVTGWRPGASPRRAREARITACPVTLRKDMRLYKGMRRWLIAILMALGLAFASAGCGPPHIKPPRVHVEVPEPVRDFNDVRNNVNKHKKVEQVQHICYDDQGIPYSYDC
jgi:hypothetical protein